MSLQSNNNKPVVELLVKSYRCQKLALKVLKPLRFFKLMPGPSNNSVILLIPVPYADYYEPIELIENFNEHSLIKVEEY